MRTEVLKSLDNVEMVVKNIVLFGSGAAENPDFENNSDGWVDLVQSRKKGRWSKNSRKMQKKSFMLETKR